MERQSKQALSRAMGNINRCTLAPLTPLPTTRRRRFNPSAMHACSGALHSPVPLKPRWRKHAGAAKRQRARGGSSRRQQRRDG